MEKTFLKLLVPFFYAVVALLLTFGIFGWVAPTLISTPSTEAVILGFGVLIITVPMLFFLCLKVLKSFDTIFNSELKE